MGVPNNWRTTVDHALSPERGIIEEIELNYSGLVEDVYPFLRKAPPAVEQNPYAREIRVATEMGYDQGDCIKKHRDNVYRGLFDAVNANPSVQALHVFQSTYLDWMINDIGVKPRYWIPLLNNRRIRSLSLNFVQDGLIPAFQKAAHLVELDMPLETMSASVLATFLETHPNLLRVAIADDVASDRKERIELAVARNRTAAETLLQELMEPEKVLSDLAKAEANARLPAILFLAEEMGWREDFVRRLPELSKRFEAETGQGLIYEDLLPLRDLELLGITTEHAQLAAQLIEAQKQTSPFAVAATQLLEGGKQTSSPALLPAVAQAKVTPFLPKTLPVIADLSEEEAQAAAEEAGADIEKALAYGRDITGKVLEIEQARLDWLTRQGVNLSGVVTLGAALEKVARARELIEPLLLEPDATGELVEPCRAQSPLSRLWGKVRGKAKEDKEPTPFERLAQASALVNESSGAIRGMVEAVDLWGRHQGEALRMNAACDKAHGAIQSRIALLLNAAEDTLLGNPMVPCADVFASRLEAMRAVDRQEEVRRGTLRNEREMLVVSLETVGALREDLLPAMVAQAADFVFQVGQMGGSRAMQEIVKGQGTLIDTNAQMQLTTMKQTLDTFQSLAEQSTRLFGQATPGLPGPRAGAGAERGLEKIDMR